ncbi:hypothetical protein [Aliamphritea spongicola]|uniref:hypothetical protein n=1 Tax=Aliamphritea spongicola TaxID=707589 RepID=UPI00196BA131|nr:hypothetical protein [Aliamphritea spongicola]MBN3564854.1 hypothetical protein [Aliamphritea spongicola]
MDKGTAPVRRIHPAGIRVWQGFRIASMAADWQRFSEQLGKIFIPATVQQMQPLGLQAYFPLILPDSGFTLPDELALVIYSSQDVYKTATRETVAGRAYGTLHGTVFNFNREGDIPKSRSFFPVAWSGNLEDSKPVYLKDAAIDWHSGVLRCLVMKSRDEHGMSDQYAQISAIANDWLEGSNETSDNVILQVEEGYLLCWEHYDNAVTNGLTDLLKTQVQGVVVIDTCAEKVMVQPLFSAPDNGVEPVAGLLMDVRLESG